MQQTGLDPDRTRGVAVVTGGCGDIGRAIAVRLHRDGLRVLLVDLLDDEAGRRVAQQIAPGVGYARADVSDEAAMSAVVAIPDRLDVVVANAGIGRSAPLLDLTAEEWHAHLTVNLTGAFVTGRAAARRMVGSGGGALVFMSSWIGSIPWPEMTAYAASKAGIEMLSKQFARELARHGVRSNVVAPGIVRAGMAKQQLEHEPQYAARVAKVIPTGELQRPEDVAAAVAYLASPDAAAVTGTKVTVDGGASLYAFD